MKRASGLMTKEGFEKLQENTANIYLAKCNNDDVLLKKLNDERKVICADVNNYVKEDSVRAKKEK